MNRMFTNYGDEFCTSAGGHDKTDIVYQIEICFSKLRDTLESAEASLDDMVQINLYLKNINDFRNPRDVFYKYFTNGFPVRMATTTNFVSPRCLCMIDGIAYKKRRV